MQTTKACPLVQLSKIKPSCQATVAPVVSSAQCRASMENSHWRSQAAHRVQKLMLVALVALVAVVLVDLSNCQAVCLGGTSSHGTCRTVETVDSEECIGVM